MSARVEGPFPSYQDVHGTDADGIRTSVDQPRTDAMTLHGVAQELRRDERAIGRFLAGSIQVAVRAPAHQSYETVATLAGEGMFAAGLVRNFANDVQGFDHGVDALNTKFHAQVRARIFGLMHQPEVRRGQVDIDKGSVRKAVKSALNGEYAQLELTLDDAAKGIAGRFRRGVSDTEIRRMIRLGLIPLSASALYPTLTLTAADEWFAAAASGATGIPLPPGLTPQDVNSWWKSLGAGGQTALIESNPEVVGNTDGIPAVARDTANRIRLPQLLQDQQAYVDAHPDDKDALEDLKGLQRLELLLGSDPHSPPAYQLLLLDNSGHPLKAAMSTGNVDEADIVSTWIGGTTSTVDGFGGDFTRLMNQHDEVMHQLWAAGDDRTHVGVLWLGYDAPDAIVDPGRLAEAEGLAKQGWKDFLPMSGSHYLGQATEILLRDGGDTQDAINTRFAKDGAPVLARFAEGIQATNPDARQTASAHSYGGAVLGGAAQRTDAWSTVVVSGTPGMFGQSSTDFQADEVYVSEAQWNEQDYSGIVDGSHIDWHKALDRLTDGGDFVPDLGHFDGRFGSDPSSMPGVVLFDNADATIDGRDLTHAHGHSSYWDRDGHALYNEANAIVGYDDKVGTR